MTLYNPLTTIKNLRKFDRVYKGKVVQNTDESFAGRIKVSIPELFGEYIEVSEEENSAGILPWIYPRFLGSFRNKFEIPEVGDIVEVIFPYDNVYLGYYTNKPLMGAQTLNEVFKTENYPNVYGDLDSNGTGWYIDKVTDTITFIQGTTQGKIVVDTEGSVIWDIPKNLTINVTEIATINAKTLNINAEDSTIIMQNGLNVQASTLAIKATTSIEGDTTITGNLDVSGTVTAANDVLAASISLKGHIHQCPGNGGPSSAPQ